MCRTSQLRPAPLPWAATQTCNYKIHKIEISREIVEREVSHRQSGAASARTCILVFTRSRGWNISVEQVALSPPAVKAVTSPLPLPPFSCISAGITEYSSLVCKLALCRSVRRCRGRAASFHCQSWIQSFHVSESHVSFKDVTTVFSLVPPASGRRSEAWAAEGVLSAQPRRLEDIHLSLFVVEGREVGKVVARGEGEN